ncbi:MAG TPA: hypothetical protein VLH09_12720, partial [Bryobacteraceae bacterium]|nr:hypothetical protein [Bryobacteraceae bacterium]
MPVASFEQQYLTPEAAQPPAAAAPPAATPSAGAAAPSTTADEQYDRAVEFARTSTVPVTDKKLWTELKIPRHEGAKLIQRMKAGGVLDDKGTPAQAVPQPAEAKPAVSPHPPPLPSGPSSQQAQVLELARRLGKPVTDKLLWTELKIPRHSGAAMVRGMKQAGFLDQQGNPRDVQQITQPQPQWVPPAVAHPAPSSSLQSAAAGQQWIGTGIPAQPAAPLPPRATEPAPAPQPDAVRSEAIVEASTITPEGLSATAGEIEAQRSKGAVAPELIDRATAEWVAGLSAWSGKPTGKGTRTLKQTVDRLSSEIAQARLQQAGQLAPPAADLVINDESYYAPDLGEEELTSEAAQALYSQVRSEQHGRLVGMEMVRQALSAPTLPDKLRKQLEHDLATYENSYENTFIEVENAFEAKVADRMRQEIEGAAKPRPAAVASQGGEAQEEQGPRRRAPAPLTKPKSGEVKIENRAGQTWLLPGEYLQDADLGTGNIGTPINAVANRLQAALREGKPVPPEVLADYPDLKPAPKPAAGKKEPNLYGIGKDIIASGMSIGSRDEPLLRPSGGH